MQSDPQSDPSLTYKEVKASLFKAVNSAPPCLRQKYFIQIGFENFVFRVMNLQQERHECLIDLSPQCLLITEEKVFDQLLGQCTPRTTLPDRILTQKALAIARGIPQWV